MLVTAELVALVGVVLFIAAIARARTEDNLGLSSEWSIRLAWTSALFSLVGGVALVLLTA